MLALLLIPALLGLALIIDTDSDDAETDAAPQTDDLVESTATGETLTTVIQPGAPDFNGGPDADRVEGTDGPNAISGGVGGDFLQGRGGDDTLDGNSGNDTIYAGDGDDSAVGGPGNDRIFLGDGDDESTPIDDPDADRGNDFIRGGAGQDGIIDLNGSDTIFGDADSDVIAAFGSANTPDAPDTIDGGAGDDALFGDNGDVMTGGTGEDIFSIIRPINTTPETVVITDFDVVEDTLALFVPEADSATETVDLRFDPTENALRAFWRGDEVAVLNGLTTADIPDVRISVFDADDLARGGF